MSKLCEIVGEARGSQEARGKPGEVGTRWVSITFTFPGRGASPPIMPMVLCK